MRDEVWILDTETTVSSSTDNKSTPFDKQNVMVMLGLLRINRKDMEQVLQYDVEKCSHISANIETYLNTPTGLYNYKLVSKYITYKDQHATVFFGLDPRKTPSPKSEKLDWSKCHTLVGHNLPFDLLWSLRDKAANTEDFAEVRIWDTMLGMYLDSGQTAISPSLNKAAAYYAKGKDRHGGKGDGPAAMWEVGYSTTDIPFHTLSKYLWRDVNLTYYVFVQQFKKAMATRSVQFYKDQMEALFAHTMITNNGMLVDKSLLQNKINIVTKSLSGCNDYFQMHLLKIVSDLYKAQDDESLCYEIPKLDSFIASRKQLSDMVYRQTITITQTVQDGTYKNGNPKMVKKEVPLHVGYAKAKDWTERLEKVLGVSPDAHGNYPLSETELNTLLENNNKELYWDGWLPVAMRNLLSSVLEYRRLAKLLRTYLEPTSRNLVAKTDTSSTQILWKIHPNFNMCITATGRLSSSRPNFHNQIDDPYKEVFIAPEGYKMVEIDYNQLEIMVLGIVSGDSKLCDLLRNGIDVHSYLYKEIHGRDPNKAERKAFKACSFGLIYGSSAAGLVASTGMPYADVIQFMTTWFQNFPDSQNYAKQIRDHLNKIAEVVPGTQPPQHTASWTMPHGRRLVFQEYDNVSPNYRGYNWRLPTLKNYPIQALASDIVKHALAKIVRQQFIDPELAKVIIVNTVHDNGVFYVPEHNTQYYIDKLESLMTDVGPWLTSRGYNTQGLQLKVESSIGTNWYNCK